MKYSTTIYFRFLFCALLSVFSLTAGFAANNQNTQGPGLQLATFDLDATPPVGSQLTYDPMVNDWDMGLRAKGLVLMGAGKPIVMCAIDWIGIANDSHDAFVDALAEAAGTTPDRVVVHTLHQHDAPTSDFGAEKWLKDAGMNPDSFEGSYARDLISRLGTAVRNSLKKAQPVTHLGTGQATVYEVASNRRLLGPDGKVKGTRTSATKDPAMRAAPEGLIDPMVSLISFWNNDKPVAILSYYASHPQSYYRTGVANPDFVGVARFFRQLAVPDALLVHFNGAGGNITAGKYNDGAKENRLILAEHLADGMKRAWEATKKEPITPASVKWTVEPLAFKPSDHIAELEQTIKTKPSTYISNNLSKLVWLKRLKAGKTIDLACLSIGSARILHLPGEPFIEYQLAAKAARPDLFVAVAGYGDYATGYIGTAIGYTQGGYETGEASGVTADAERTLMTAINKLLGKEKKATSKK